MRIVSRVTQIVLGFFWMLKRRLDWWLEEQNR